MRLAIQGIGVTAGFGSGIEALEAALRCAKAGPQQKSVEYQGRVDSYPLYRASIAALDEFIPKRALRRIDYFSQMTLLSACLALKDAGLLESARPRMGVVLATGYGALKTTFDFLDSYLDFGYACSSPTSFSNSVHNAAAAHVSMHFKATAPSLTVTQFEMSVPSALLTAQLWLAEGRVDQVLFGAIDEHCDVLHYCRKQFFGAAEQGPLQPLQFDKQSAVAGEGASFFVLTREVEGAAYAHIDGLQLGNHCISPISLPAEDLLLIGADGHKECGRWYAQALGGREALAYAPLYGSFPAAAGLDLAIAALSLRSGTRFADPVSCTGDSSSPAPEKLQAEKLSYLKFGPGGDYGLVRLSL